MEVKKTCRRLPTDPMQSVDGRFVGCKGSLKKSRDPIHSKVLM